MMAPDGRPPAAAQPPPDPAPAPAPDFHAARGVRRSLTMWLALCVVGVGLVLVASGRTWVTVVFDPRPGGLGSGRLALTGARLSPLAVPAALAALAAVAAVFATRGLTRRLIGAVIALCGIAVAEAVWNGTRPGPITAAAAESATVEVSGRAALAVESVAWVWPSLAVVGGVMLLGGGAVAAIRGGRWPGMSARYDPIPAGAGRTRSTAGERGRGDQGLWEAIDRGVDPTVRPSDRGGFDGGPESRGS